MIFGSIAGGLATGLAGKLFGGGGDSGGGGGGIFGFKSPGLVGKVGGDKFRVFESEERQTLIDQIQNSLRESGQTVRNLIPGFNNAFNTALLGIDDLAARVRPGVSELRKARLEQIENARQRSLSDLTQNLARRRVLGSSFANDAAARSNLAFAQEAEQVAAESFLQELDLTNQFLQQRLTTDVARIDTELQNTLSAISFERAADQFELENQNFLAGLAAQLASGATSAQTALSAQELELAAQNAAGAGRFFGSTGITEAVGQGIADILKDIGVLQGPTVRLPA